MKYPDVTGGQNEAVINKLGGVDGLQRFLAGELIVVEKTKQISANGLANGGISFAQPAIPDVKLFLDEMKDFYGQVYGILKLPKVRLPERRPGFCWGLIMPASITVEQDLIWCAKEYKVRRWTQDDFDLIVTNVRSTEKGPYAIWLRDRVEADEEHKNKSYNVIIEAKINSIMLLERIRLERWFYWRTKGRHLDIDNVTLCAGSRYSDGGVPRVGWCGVDARLGVYWCFPDGARGRLRTREVVSLADASAAA